MFNWTLQMFAAEYHGTEQFIDPANTGNNTTYTAGSANDYGVYEGTEGLSVEMKTFYTEQLLRKAGPKLVHEQFGKSAPIPARKGDRAEFRYRKSLPKALTPLVEGVTPDPGRMTIVPLYADVEQFGNWLGYTDKLSLTAIDPIVSEMTTALSEQAGLTCDTVVREIINGGSNVRFAMKNAGTASASAVSARSALDNTSVITVKDVFKMAAILKAANAPTKDGYFVAIAHPHVIYDLMMGAPDGMWRNVMSYAKPENMLKGEVGELGGVRFVSTSEAKIFKGELLPGVATAVVKTAVTSDDDVTLTIPSGVTVAANALKDHYIVIGDARYKVASNSANSGTDLAIVLTESVTVAANAVVSAGDTGKNGAPVYSTLFIAGSEAYGVVDLGGTGIEFIAKPLGSGNDQLNQRGSVGWKTFKGAVILHQEYLLRYESSSTMADEITTAN